MWRKRTQIPHTDVTMIQSDWLLQSALVTRVLCLCLERTTVMSSEWAWTVVICEAWGKRPCVRFRSHLSDPGGLRWMNSCIWPWFSPLDIKDSGMDWVMKIEWLWSYSMLSEANMYVFKLPVQHLSERRNEITSCFKKLLCTQHDKNSHVLCPQWFGHLNRNL